MSQLALSGSFEYLCYGSTSIRIFFSLGIIFIQQNLTSTDDVYRRTILTHKDNPRTVGVLRKGEILVENIIIKLEFVKIPTALVRGH